MRLLIHSSFSLLSQRELRPGSIDAGNRASEINRQNHLSVIPVSPVMNAMSINGASGNNVMQILLFATAPFISMVNVPVAELFRKTMSVVNEAQRTSFSYYAPGCKN